MCMAARGHINNENVKQVCSKITSGLHVFGNARAEGKREQMGQNVYA